MQKTDEDVDITYDGKSYIDDKTVKSADLHLQAELCISVYQHFPKDRGFRLQLLLLDLIGFCFQPVLVTKHFYIRSDTFNAGKQPLTVISYILCFL